MESKDCPECSQLRERYWALHAECVGARDELTMTRKNDPSYLLKRKELERLEALQRDAFHQSSVHREDIETQTDPRSRFPNWTQAKIYFQKLAYFRRRKSVRQAPRFTTQFTTTSPRFTIKKHHKNSKTPCKNHAPPQKHFFRTHNPKTPPVRLDRCGLSSPSCSSPLSPWRRTLPQLATRATRSGRNPT